MTMSVIDVVESQTERRKHSVVDAAVIPSEHWAHPDRSVWSGRYPRRVSRVELHPRVESRAERRRGYLFAKRCLDVVGAVVALALFSPVILLAAALVKLTDWGPVLYAHTRVGLRGAEFRCFKFRSMVVNADRLQADLEGWNSHADSRTFKIPDDPRVTWIGRLMRRSSVDELPQLINVLVGHMSLVGPRPPVPHEVARYSADDLRRLAVKPGLTGLWQVSGRSRLPFPEQLRLDVEYIENRSLLFDLVLIARTLPAVLKADGAY